MFGRFTRQSHALLSVGILLSTAGAARAGLTSVHAPPTGEATHAQIFSHVYGGVFAPAPNGASSYSNGSITATRIDDVLSTGGIGSDLHLVFGAPGLPTTDQRWRDGIAVTSAEAKFAGYNQEFGYDDGGGYVKLFDVTSTGSTGFDVAGSASHHFQPGIPWNWVRSGTGRTYYSENSRNVDGLDHMVTYLITGLATTDTVWMVFWEDLPGGLNQGGFGESKSDRDFNDLVVEIRASVAHVIPIPGAAWLAACGMGLLGVVTRRRRA